MPLPQTASCHFLSKALIRFGALLLLLGCAPDARAQHAENLSQVKKIYVASFGEDDLANKLRERIVKQLRKNGRLEVAQAPEEADAVIKGNESVWVTGYYSTSPRSPLFARQPIIHGFLSVEMLA
jgi:hypothetical protein